MSRRTSRSAARPGQVVTTDEGLRVVLVDRAAPSGWWAQIVGAPGPKPARAVRVFRSRRHTEAGTRWRVA